MPSGMRSLFVDQIVAAIDVLGEMLGCQEVGVCWMTLWRPMCLRFHVGARPNFFLVESQSDYH
ncbi:MAG: hypothetical protein ACI8PP_002040 [Candidatus Pseudothioglobus sp.]|jgi:hypothetical protein